MKTLVLLVLGALLVAGCGSDGGSDGAGAARSGGVTDGTYEVGKDIEPGVYTAAADCVGTISSKPDYSHGLTANPDDFLGGSLQVGDVQRVVLKAGEFFMSEVCRDGWQREDSTVPATPDPATRAGACTILLQEKLADEAVDVLKESAGSADRGPRVDEVQEKLMAVVYSHTKGLWRPAGELVDFLDAPDAFFESGKLDSRVDRALATIRQYCD